MTGVLYHLGEGAVVYTVRELVTGALTQGRVWFQGEMRVFGAGWRVGHLARGSCGQSRVLHGAL